MGVRFFAVVALLAIGAQQPSQQTSAPAQSPPQSQSQSQSTDAQGRPVFRTGTQYVRVDAYPTRHGEVIEGLTADDFELFEDGKPQTVALADFVAFDDLPDDDRGTNLSPREGLQLAGDSRYRVIVFVIDREALDREQWPPMRDALIEFLEHEVTPRDLLALITTDRSWPDLAIGKRLSEIQRELDSPQWITPVMSEQRMVLNGCGFDGLMRRIQADETYALLEGLVQMLGQVREDRTSIVYVSNGLMRQGPDRRAADQRSLSMPPSIGLVNGRIQRVPKATDMHDQFCKSELRRLADTDFARRFDDLITSARAANVSFYPIAVPMMMPALPVAPDSPMARLVAKVPVRMNGGLGNLAAATDGLMIPAEADISRGLRRIVEDVTSHYLLGYYSSNPKADGRIRTIKVRLKKTGEVVRARPFYRAPSRKEAKTLAERPAPPSFVVPEHVTTALDVLSHARPSAQFYAYPAVAGSTMRVVVEVPQAAVDAGRWSEGASLEVVADAASGDTLAVGRGRLAANGRALLRVPLTGGAKPASVLVRIRADGESLVERSILSAEEHRLIGDPIGYRSGPRGLAIPVALFEFAREEKLRLDWPLLAKADAVEARVLDRHGQPLKHRVAAAVQQTAEGSQAVTDMTLTALGRGEYLVELTATAGSVTDRKVIAFRVR